MELKLQLARSIKADIESAREKISALEELIGESEPDPGSLDPPVTTSSSILDVALAIISRHEGGTLKVHRKVADEGLTVGLIGFRGQWLKELQQRFLKRTNILIPLDNDAEWDRMADHELMYSVQVEVAYEYFREVARISIFPRAISTPLGQAMLMGMAVNHGLLHGFIQGMEEIMGFAKIINGNYIKQQVHLYPGGERKWLHDLATTRWEQLKDEIKRKNPGLRPRYSWWVDIINSGNFDLEGEIMLKGVAMSFAQPIKTLIPEVKPLPTRRMFVGINLPDPDAPYFPGVARMR